MGQKRIGGGTLEVAGAVPGDTLGFMDRQVSSETGEGLPGRSEDFDFDWVIVGSGFGGSVSALRLAEKGYRVAVIEVGRRFGERDYAKTAWNLRRYFWMPRLGMRGILRMTPFKDLFVVSGSGVGGGSLGYANTLYRPRPAFYTAAQWGSMADWEKELGPH